jgi:HKD family nuclease
MRKQEGSSVVTSMYIRREGGFGGGSNPERCGVINSIAITQTALVSAQEHTLPFSEGVS